MAVQAVKYGAIALNSNNNKTLQRDDKGFFKCVVGGFNVCNYGGIEYPLMPSVQKLFEPGGIILRRLNTGLLKGEYKHPDVRGLKYDEAFRRVIVIDELLVSHYIRSLELVPAKDEFGKSIVLVVAWLAPTGPYGPTLLKQLENQEENVAFSVRCLFDLITKNGKEARIVKDIFTYDHVFEPGISVATKFNSVALEDIYGNLLITEDLVDRAIIKETSSQYATESISSLVMVKHNLGWVKTEVIKTRAVNW